VEVEGRCCLVVWLGELAPTQASSVAQPWLWRWRRREPLAASSYRRLATPTLPHCVPCHRKSSFLATNALCNRGNQRLNQYVLCAVHFDHTFLCCRQPNPVSSSHKDLMLICAHRIDLCTTCITCH
jgi:hypothetical protein